MTYALATINPAYAARLARPPHNSMPQPTEPASNAAPVVRIGDQPFQHDFSWCKSCSSRDVE
jgi:hypothetical protein